MLTIMVFAKIKEERLEDYLEMASLVTRETVGKRPGCISYSFNQSIESPTEFVLFEQWESQKDMENHVKELCRLFGDPPPGYPLPKKILEMYESAKPAYYKQVEPNA